MQQLRQDRIQLTKLDKKNINWISKEKKRSILELSVKILFIIIIQIFYIYKYVYLQRFCFNN